MVALPAFLALHRLAQLGDEDRRLRQEKEGEDGVVEAKSARKLKACCRQGAAPAMVSSGAVSA